MLDCGFRNIPHDASSMTSTGLGGLANGRHGGGLNMNLRDPL